MLTPAAGAPHSDPFQVSSIQGVANFKPYIATIPMNRRGRIDPLSKKTDVGQIVLTLMDPIIPGQSSQLKRWLSAYFGDAGGRPRAMGLKAVMNESLDGGASYDTGGLPFWTGRIRALKEASKNTFELTIWDTRTDLKMMAYVGKPHPNVTYAGPLSLLPLGVTVPYGTLVPPAPVPGSTSFPAFLPSGGAMGIAFSFDASAVRARKDMIVTQELLAGILPGTPISIAGNTVSGLYVPNYGGNLRAVIKWTSGALSGQTGTYIVGGLNQGILQTGNFSGLSIYINTLVSGQPGFLALPAAGVTGQLLYSYRDGMPIGADNVLLVNDVHPVQFFKDHCLGYYSFLYQPGETRPAGKNLGDPKRVLGTDATSFANLIADTSFGTLRRIIDKMAPTGDDLEQFVCQSFQFGYYLNGAGNIVVVDLRRPTAIPGTTLTDTDIAADASFDWSQDQSSAVQRIDAKFYKDYNLLIDGAIQKGSTTPKAIDALLARIQMQLTVFDVGAGDLAVDKVLTIDAQGYRTMDGEVYQGIRRDDYILGALEGAVRNLSQPYGYGAITANLNMRRTANVTGTNVGDLRVIQVSWLPDPFTYVRGGARIMRLLEKSENGPTITGLWLDLGSASTAGVPSIGNISSDASNPSHGAFAVVTLNGAADPVECHIALTASSVGSAPAQNDPAWHFFTMVYATGSVVFSPIPAGQKVWARVRSLPTAYDAVIQPSAWVVAANSVTTTAITAPSALTISAVGSTSAIVSWTAGDTSLPTEVRLSQPNGQPFVVVATPWPGTTRTVLTGLDPGTTIGIDIAHTDRHGGYSSRVSTTFATLSANNDIPAPPVAHGRLHIFR